MSPVIKNETKKAKMQEKIIEKMIDIIRLRKELFCIPNAKSAPNNEKIIAWLSLDGSPKNHASTPKSTTAIKHERQTTDVLCGEVILTMENMLLATDAPTKDDTKTPKKLKIPDRSAPCQSFSLPEATIEKIEPGASVHPLMKTTTKAKKNTKKSRGVFVFDKKSKILTSFFTWLG